DGLITGGGQVVAHAPPPGDGQLMQPRPAPGRQILRRARGSGSRRVLLYERGTPGGGRVRAALGGWLVRGGPEGGPLRAFPAQRGVEPSQQGVVGRAEQGGTGARQGKQVLIADGP